MSDHEDMRKAMVSMTAKAMALEMLVLAVFSESADKVKILKALDEEMTNRSTRTLFESEMKDCPETELAVACDILCGQLNALC